MRKRILFPILAAALVTLTGCTDFSFRDAVLAGVFDFVSGSVTTILSTMVPVPGA